MSNKNFIINLISPTSSFELSLRVSKGVAAKAGTICLPQEKTDVDGVEQAGTHRGRMRARIAASASAFFLDFCNLTLFQKLNRI